MKKSTTPTVDAIGELNFNAMLTIPPMWFKAITLPSGKPDTIGVILLAETKYWYTPTIVRDEASGEITEVKRKFKSDKWQCNYGPLGARFGFTRRQAEDAMQRLKRRGLVTLETRTFSVASGQKVGNALFIEPVVAALRKISGLTLHVRTGQGVTACKHTRDSVLPHTRKRARGIRGNVPPPTRKRATNTSVPTSNPTSTPTSIPTSSSSKRPGLIARYTELMMMNFGIDEPVAYDIAKQPHVTEEYLQQWIEYERKHTDRKFAAGRESECLGAGFFVKHLRAGDVPIRIARMTAEQARDAAHADDAAYWKAKNARGQHMKRAPQKRGANWAAAG